ncbi:MAG: TonB-dependent receptor [Paracoccaceae bacterium]|nr:TonB-dependent receptor [Paracoccaceae bacterium]
MYKNLNIIIMVGFMAIGFNVKAEEIDLSEISISANRVATPLADVGSSVTVLSQEDISTSSESYVIDFISKVPGVNVSQNGPKGSTSGLTLRGLGLKYVKVLVDGIDIGDVSSIPVMANLSGIMLNSIERIEILQGSQSALYGSSAIGGVISLTTKKVAKENTSVSLEGGTYGTVSLNLEKTISSENSDILVSGSYFSTEGFSAKVNGVENDGYSSSRMSVTGNYYLSDENSISISMFKQEEDGDQDGYDPVSFEFVDKDDEVFSNDSVGVAAGVEMNSGNIVRNLNFNFFNIDRFYTGPYNYQGTNLEVSWQEKRTLDNGSLIYGLVADNERTLIEEVSKEINQSHIFSEYIFSDQERFGFTLSGRASGHSEFGGSSTARVNVSYKLNGRTILRSSLGSGYRAPSLYELFAPYYGNSNLQPETSVTADFGVELPLVYKKGSLSATFFETTISDRIVYDYDTFAYGQSTEVEKIAGYEIGFNYKPNLRSEVNLSFTHTVDGNGNRIQKVPESDLTLSANTKLLSGLTLSGSLQSVSGLEDFVSLPDYNIVSVRGSYPLTEEIEVYIRGENIFDTQYQTASEYGTSGQAVYTGFNAKF